MSQPQDNAAGLFRHISLKAPAKPKLTNLPVFQLKPSLTNAKPSFSLPKTGFHKTAESSSEPFTSVDDSRSEVSESQKINESADSSRKRFLEPPFELPASKRAKIVEDRQSSLDQVALPLPAENVETIDMEEYQANDAEIAQYQDYFVERTNEYEKILEGVTKELGDTQEGLKELSVNLLTINNEMLVYNNPIFSGHNPHLEKEE